jgi:23S rRNA pseudouridine1911/1915/1917 synthase
MKLDVLYEDNHLIAVYKPAGMLVQGDETGDACLMDAVKAYLKEKYQKPGNVFLGLLHRLDRPVSGIVLFAKTSKGASRLSEQFRTHRVVKIYHALVIGEPKESKARLTHFLIKNEEKNVTTVYDTPQDGALEAILSYEVVERRGAQTLFRISLETGRPHQIRAQLSHIGHPIVGDLKYGAPEPLPDRSIALAATSLEFDTATGGEQKVITIPFTI